MIFCFRFLQFLCPGGGRGGGGGGGKIVVVRNNNWVLFRSDCQPPQKVVQCNWMGHDSQNPDRILSIKKETQVQNCVGELVTIDKGTTVAVAVAANSIVQKEQSHVTYSWVKKISFLTDCHV